MQCPEACKGDALPPWQSVLSHAAELIVSGRSSPDLGVPAQGAHLATASGDSSVKLWSFAHQKCVATLKGHARAVWGVAWHDQGTFLASCSLDHGVRIWDFPTGAMRQALRWDSAAQPPSAEELVDFQRSVEVPARWMVEVGSDGSLDRAAPIWGRLHAPGAGWDP